MNSQINSASNITHVRGLYSIDESVPISKFVYKKDQSYLYYYQKKKNANQIRRNCFKTMNIFEPVYYVRMMEYQNIQQKVRFHEPYSFDIEALAKDSNDLQCPRFSRYSDSKYLYSSSFTRLSASNPIPSCYSMKKKRSHTSKSRSKSQKRSHSRSIITSHSDNYFDSPIRQKKKYNSFSPNNSQIEKDISYEREKRKIKMMIIKKFYKKWYLSWCTKKSMLMGQVKLDQ